MPARCLLSFCCFCSCHVSSPVFSALFCSAALQPGRPPDWSGQRHTGTLRRLRARLAGLQAACRCTGLLAQPQQRRLSGSLAQLPAHLLGALQTKPGDPASNPAFSSVFWQDMTISSLSFTPGREAVVHFVRPFYYESGASSLRAVQAGAAGGAAVSRVV